MEQLTKLIKQYEKENPDKPKVIQWLNNFISFYHREFVLWLASRPSCTPTERKFLDRLKRISTVDSQGDIICPRKNEYQKYNIYIDSELFYGISLKEIVNEQF